MDSDSRINRIILALYLSFILICQVIASPELCGSYLVIGVVAVTVFSFVVSPFIIRFFSRLSVNDKTRFDKLTPVKLKLLFYGVPLSSCFITLHIIRVDSSTIHCHSSISIFMGSTVTGILRSIHCLLSHCRLSLPTDGSVPSYCFRY